MLWLFREASSNQSTCIKIWCKVRRYRLDRDTRVYAKTPGIYFNTTENARPPVDTNIKSNRYESVQLTLCFYHFIPQNNWKHIKQISTIHIDGKLLYDLVLYSNVRNSQFPSLISIYIIGKTCTVLVAVTLQEKKGICVSASRHVKTLRPRRNEKHFADDIFKRTFFNENMWISIKGSLNLVPKGPMNNIPALIQIMAWRCSGDKPIPEPMMVSLPTHMFVTRPQWVKVYAWCVITQVVKGRFIGTSNYGIIIANNNFKEIRTKCYSKFVVK